MDPKLSVVMFSNGLPCRLPFPSCLGGVPKDSGSDELLPVSMGNREPVILNVYDMVSNYYLYYWERKKNKLILTDLV